MARYGLSELVFTVAPSLSQYAARWTRGLAVTVVQHLVIAEMLAGTWPIANGPPRTARYRWKDHLGTALAVQLFEAALPTWRTSPHVASLPALVPTAAQRLRTRQRADVLDVDAAQLIAIVLAAGTFLLATLLAARVVSFTGQVLAIDLAVHVTASALDIGVQVALRTFVDVARCLAHVWITRLAAFQTLRTDFVTDGHRIQATLSLLR